jgi:nicotinate-nucleotide pyrophosphorylase (carboxylating)
MTNLRIEFAPPPLPPAVWRLIDMALDEDFGRGDITSESMFGENETARAILLAKSKLCLSGLDVAQAVFERVDARCQCKPLYRDGSLLQPGTQVMTVEGPLRALLAAERTALNFVQRLSGVASLARRYVDLVAGTGARIVDTRKTVPGFRFLDKRAVRHGGAHNHRFDLASGVLIKDNHIAAAGSVTAAVTRVRDHAPHSVRIEVEVTTLEQLAEALAVGAELVLLDNMRPEEVQEAMATLPAKGAPGRPLIEVSGGVNLSTVRAYAEAGVDLISVGALTHSVPAADLSLEILQGA